MNRGQTIIDLSAFCSPCGAAERKGHNMEKEKMDRLSEFTRLSRERALTGEEQAERRVLREEYLAEWRISTESVLENTYIVDEFGNKRKLGRNQ